MTLGRDLDHQSYDFSGGVRLLSRKCQDSELSYFFIQKIAGPRDL